MFDTIDQKKRKIDKKRPLPKNTLKSLREKLFLEWIYISNAIEGNTLTLSETKVVQEDGITIGGKTLDRVKYYESLDKAHTADNYSDFIDLVSESLNRSLDIYLDIIS